jgi:hypothetical protein
VPLGCSTMSVRDMQKRHRIAPEILTRRTGAHSGGHECFSIWLHGNTCACPPDPSQTLESGLSFPHLAHLQLQTQIPTVLANGLEVLLIGSIRGPTADTRKEVNSGNAPQTRDGGVIAYGIRREGIAEEAATKPTQRRRKPQ